MDNLTRDSGPIFLWTALFVDRGSGCKNHPVGPPRAHKLAYSDELLQLVTEARQRLKRVQ